MSLTRVISRFLFSPLSLIGTRFAMRRRWATIPAKIIGLWLPLMINFQIIGLWHGATLTFLAFGFTHGVWYAIETEVRSSKVWKKWKKKTPEARRALYGRMVLLAFMPLTQAIFRAPSINAAWFLGSQLFSPHWIASDNWKPAIEWLLPAFGLIYLAPNSIELLRNYRPGIMTYTNPSYGSVIPGLAWRPNWKWACFGAALLVAGLCAMNDLPPFLYQGF